MKTRGTDKFIEPHLREGEETEMSLRGVISGFSRWSAVGGAVAVSAALVVPQALGLGLLPGLGIVVIAITLAFLLILNAVGKPMAARHDPVLATPYVTIALTNRRLLLIERGLGRELSKLVEEAPRSHVSLLSYTKGGIIKPQRLSYRTGSNERSFEFPRMERASLFAETLED